MSDDLTISRKALRQAIYDTYFDIFGGDQQDQADIEAADEFCRVVLSHIDGSTDG